MNKYDWFEKTGYTPHEEQREFHDSDARFRLIVADRRWGMTTALAKEAEVMLMKSNSKGWVVGETWDMIWAIMIQIELDMVPQSAIFKPGNVCGMRYPWGAIVEGKVAQHPESMVGENDVDWVVWDNCAMSKDNIWNDFVFPALKHRRTVNPKQRWYKKLPQKTFPRWFKIPDPITIPGGKVVLATTLLTRNWVYDTWKRWERQQSTECWIGTYLGHTGESAGDAKP